MYSKANSNQKGDVVTADGRNGSSFRRFFVTAQFCEEARVEIGFTAQSADRVCIRVQIAGVLSGTAFRPGDCQRLRKTHLNFTVIHI